MAYRNLKNPKLKCFGSRVVGHSIYCDVLDVNDCTGCRFYMTRKQYNKKMEEMKKRRELK